jgi:hypothetical protein
MEPGTASLTIYGSGASEYDFDTFANNFAARFGGQIQNVTCDIADGWRWHLKCKLIDSSDEVLAALKIYLRSHFPGERGELDIDGARHDIFGTLLGVFYVWNVTDDECRKIEVQTVDCRGRAKEWCIVDKNEDTITIGTTLVPRAVIDAGFRLAVGTGDFVDLYGIQVAPNEFDKYLTN